MAKFCPQCGESFDDAAQLCPYDGTDLEVRREQDDSNIGRIVDDRFRLEALLGRGGMGRVYEATQLSVGRRVAVKMIRLQGLDRERIKRRFFREAKVVSELSHPNIVTLLEFGEDDELGVPYIAMEYIDGLDVRDALDDGRLHPRFVVEIASQVAAALVEAHGAGIIHRDLKTDNVLLVPVSSGGFQAKVIDFGIALPTQNSETLTDSGMICGTPKYVSPEQARNADIDHRTDLYSLGVVIYEMTTGQLPFESDSALNVMMKHVRQPPPSIPRRLGPNEIPAGLANLVADLLSKAPEDRPDDAQDVRRRLQSIQTEQGWSTLELDTGRSMEEKLQAWVLPRISRSTTQDDAVPEEVVRATDERPPPAFSAPCFGGTPPNASKLEIHEATGEDDPPAPSNANTPPGEEEQPRPRIVGVPQPGSSPPEKAPPRTSSGQNADSDGTPASAAAPDPTGEDTKTGKTHRVDRAPKPASGSHGDSKLQLLRAGALAGIILAAVAVWRWSGDTDSNPDATVASDRTPTAAEPSPNSESTAPKSARGLPEKPPPQPSAVAPETDATSEPRARGPDAGGSDAAEVEPAPDPPVAQSETREGRDPAPSESEREPSRGDDELSEKINEASKWLLNE